jgi:hypothetical protein
MITAQMLRDLYYREPFEPFRVVLKDGRAFYVEKPTHYSISPTGKNMVYAPRMEDFEIIELVDIASLQKAGEPAGAH